MSRALAHQLGDDVAIAVAPISAGNTVEVAFLDSGEVRAVTALANVPYGHKVALCDRSLGEPITEYGVPVAVASQDIVAGDYVHIHNVRTARW